MSDNNRSKQAIESIQQNIREHGRHVYVVAGGSCPRFAYTIGVSRLLGEELILAGTSFYSNDDMGQILNEVATRLAAGVDAKSGKLVVADFGSFFLRRAHSSWGSTLMLGALDFYGVSDVPALQLVPDQAHVTIDVPDTSVELDFRREPIWRWLTEPWSYSIASDSVAVTNIAALRGERITEAVRWEEDEWELFAGAGPDVPPEEVRRVPIGTLLAADASLHPIVNLPKNGGIWRDAISEWHHWR